MTDQTSNLPYTLGPDDRVLPMMVYTANMLARGEMILKQSIRMGTWFRSATSADYLRLYRATVLLLSGPTPQVISLTEFLIPALPILAAHVTPPAQEPPDYDASEPNRKLVGITALFGPFRVIAKLRISASTNIGAHLNTSKETFQSVYDAEISSTAIPNMGIVRTSLMILRPAAVAFSPRELAE